LVVTDHIQGQVRLGQMPKQSMGWLRSAGCN
jgi:hypothetical protein